MAGQLMKVAATLTKNILSPLGTTTAASAIDTRKRKYKGVLEENTTGLWKYNFNNFK